MLKLFKITALTLIALLVLAIITLVIVANVTDPNHFKSPIQTQITRLTGLNTEIAGDLKWKFFPMLGLTVDEVSLENPQGFQNEKFASINQIGFEVKLLPLIRGKVEIKQINLDELSLNIEVNAAGEQNFASLKGVQDSDTTPTTQLPPPSNVVHQASEARSELPILTALNIAEFSVKRGSISYFNQTDNQKFKIADINFSSENIQLDHRFPISLTFAVEGEQADNVIATGNFDLTGDINIDRETLLSSNQPLQALQFKGHLQAKPIMFQQLHIDKLSTYIDLHNSIIDVSPINIDLYQGHSSGSISVNLAQEKPAFSLTQKIQGIQTGPLFTDLIGINRITGTATSTIELSAEGHDTDEITQSLTGNVDFSVMDGTLEGIDIPYLVEWGTALFQGINTPPSNETENRTQFGSLTGNATVQRGVISTQDLQLESPNYVITGTGKADLNKQDLNFSLQTRILGLADNNVIQQTQQALGGSFPILITGTFTDLRVVPDITTSVLNRASSLLQQQADRLLNRHDVQTNADSDDNTGSEDDIVARGRELLNQFIPRS